MQPLVRRHAPTGVHLQGCGQYDGWGWGVCGGVDLDGIRMQCPRECATPPRHNNGRPPTSWGYEVIHAYSLVPLNIWPQATMIQILCTPTHHKGRQ